MKKIMLMPIILCLFFVSEVFAQDPGDLIWSNSYGGIDTEYGYSVNLTTDGCYIMGGYSNSFGAGDNDVYLVKTDADGDTLWTRTYGGIGTDKCKSVQQCSDGGYIIAGETNSFGAGNYDIYLIKTDANGDTLWTRTFGGTGIDRGESVIEATDDGYIVTGTTGSFGAGGKDVYLIKTDANGNTLWTKTFGAINNEEGQSVLQTTDGDYIIAGFTNSFGAGGNDVYLIKTDVNGDTLWTSTHGGTNDDRGYSVQQCNDGSFVIAGDTKSSGAGLSDFYLVKTDANGETLWTNAYGGSAIDIGYSVQQDSDGGYIIAGSTQSFNVGYFDIYLVKTDAIGDTLWTRTYGSFDYEHGRSVQLTTDGNYVVAGWTFSYGPGITAFWLLKITGEGTSFYPPENLSVDESIGLATWEPPLTRDLIGYNVYRDGVFIDFTTDLFWQYTNLVAGTTYMAGISALYDDPGESIIIEYEFTYDPVVFFPPENLMVDESTGLATWEPPLGRDLLGYKIYQDGVYIQFTTDLFWQYDDLVVGTTYLAGVSALYDDPGESVIIEYEFTYSPTVFDPPENVQVDPYTGILTWGGAIFFEDFESYTAGEYLALQSDDWVTWSGTVGGPDDVLVVDELSYNGNNSIKIEGLDDDVVHLFGNLTSGVYEISHYQYFVPGYGGYFNLLHEFTGDRARTEWALEVYFASDGTGYINAGGYNAATFTYTQGAWVECWTMVDLDNDWAELWIDGNFVHEWQWSLQFSGGAGMNMLGAIDIWAGAPAGDLVMYYVDNVKYDLISTSDDLLGYNVYLDGTLVAFTTNSPYQLTGLVIGQTYVAGVSAVYDGGESEIVEASFTYNPIFNPPQNLVVECIEDYAHFTWEAPAADLNPGDRKTKANAEGTRDLTGYNVYLDQVEVASNIPDLEYDFYDLLNGEYYDAGVRAIYDDGESELVEINFLYTGTGVGNILPLITELTGNYPNPFNPETNISFSLKEAGKVTLEVYNIKGEKVRTLVDKVLAADNHVITWDGKNNTNKSVASGIYFYKMISEGNSGEYTSTKKMILLK